MKQKLLRYFELDSLKRTDVIFTFVCIFFCILLYYIPTGFEGAQNENTKSVKAVLTEVDNSAIHSIGLIKTGEQFLTIKVANGQYKGKEYQAINHFSGKLEIDKFYKKGDKVFAVLETQGAEVTSAQVVDKYRISYELILVSIFSIVLIIYGGFTGLKSIISFFFSILLIWKIMLPMYLKAFNPIILSFIIVSILSFVIIFLVAGFNKKGLVAFWGAISGVFITTVLSVYFGRLFQIPGEIKPFAESLLYSGFSNLDLSAIFLSSIFIANSGAVMDISTDISASLAEIKHKKPNIKGSELVVSGIKIGRAVTGTMTTTLLLAYSGGYSTLLMIFISQGIPIENILNLQYVAAEILHTLVGSFGLVLVAPLTAIIGGFIFSYEKKEYQSIDQLEETI